MSPATLAQQAESQLAALLALGLDWFGWSAVDARVIAGSLLALAVLVWGRWTGRHQRGAPVTFGPYLCLGALLAVLLTQ